MDFMLQGINIPLFQFERQSPVLERIKTKECNTKEWRTMVDFFKIRTRAKKTVAECDSLVEKGVRNVIKHKAIILPHASVPLQVILKFLFSFFFVPAAREHLS